MSTEVPASAAGSAADAVARAAALSRALTDRLAAAREAAGCASSVGAAARTTEPAAPAAEASAHGPRLVVDAAGGMAGAGADATQRAHTASLVRRFTERTRTSKELAQHHVRRSPTAGPSWGSGTRRRRCSTRSPPVRRTDPA